MIICGIDMSVNSPAVVKFHLDDNYNVIYKDYLGFTQVKKYQCDNILHYNKKDFKDNYAQYLYIKDNIESFIKGSDYVAIEGYSYNSTGRIFDIAEISGLVKISIYQFGIPLRIYEPSTVKISNRCKGNCDKISMEESYNKLEDKIDLFHLPAVYEKKSGNPADNIIDAFTICNLLLVELKLRKELLKVDELEPHLKKIFTRIKKKKDIMVLDQDFIQKA